MLNQSTSSVEKEGEAWEDSGISSTNVHHWSESRESDSKAEGGANTIDDDRLIIDKTKIHHGSTSNWAHVFSLTLFSIYGITIRSFMGRFFGGDCANATPINDWLTPLSQHICVTTTGTTEQYGGALFIDLPANMFGSFVMGFLTGNSKDWPVLPWLKHDHPLQYHDGLHLGLKTALCGTITTFSSWNAQMVLMMSGTGTVLGSQVIAALFGYILGLQIAVASFRTGRTLAAWFHFQVNPHIFDVDVSIPNSLEATDRLRWHHRLDASVIPSVGASALFVLYVLGDFYWKIDYYREVWVSCLFGPFGTIMRWKIAALNGKLKYNNWQWFPIGTFLSNVIASTVSCSISAVFIASLVRKSTLTYDLLVGIKVGFAGCLSTVSSMVKEIVEITDKNALFDKKAFIYSYGTLMSCCFIGLIVYCPLVRFA